MDNSTDGEHAGTKSSEAVEPQDDLSISLRLGAYIRFGYERYC